MALAKLRLAQSQSGGNPPILAQLEEIGADNESSLSPSVVYGFGDDQMRSVPAATLS